MKALVKYGYGQGQTELRDVPVPEIGEDDLLIEVKAAGVCGSDIGFDNGEHPEYLRPPVILGHEFAGVVHRVGHRVSGWKAGDRVVSDNTGYVCGVCYACLTADYLNCPERLGLGYGMDGGFTQYVKISGDVMRKHPSCLHAIPDSVSFEEAAILDPACNAYKAVVQESRLLPGDDVVVYGVGALGLCSIQIARLAGAANIIAVASSRNQARFEIARKLGATHLIRYDQEDVAEQVKHITKGEPVALVVDCAGPNSVLREAMKLVRPGGTINRVGFDGAPPDFSLDPMVNKGIKVQGHFAYDIVSWRHCLKLLALGKLDLKSVISGTLPLAEWDRAFELTRSKQASKVILTYE
ncbi:MAG: alcohol dehydrogenase [Paenibacillus sp.]|jgi:threonine dehydrogenase-like Zn-dependent dehydrogenase|nr:alcohol dehydrogenase [Paenibacillus sp.]